MKKAAWAAAAGTIPAMSGTKELEAGVVAAAVVSQGATPTVNGADPAGPAGPADQGATEAAVTAPD